jgi:glucose/arabinose dehydrogenase
MDHGTFDCATVTPEEAQFPLNDTPFGLDWERGVWPTPFNGGLFVALHGSFYSSPPWQGSRVVFAPTDPVTHAPTGPFQDIVRGFGYAHAGGAPMERATDVAFAPDGRLFIADDMANAIYWVAPAGLAMR